VSDPLFLAHAVGRARSKFIRFRMPQRIGLFATLTHCLLLSKYCAEEGLRPIFLIENELYGSNWFDHLFRHRAVPTADDDDVGSILLNDRLEINAFTRGSKEAEIINEFASILDGARLFHQFLEIREHVRQVMEAAAARLIADRTVGVHYRGTDKFGLESSTVSYPDVLAAIASTADATAPIYLATDDLNFFEFMRARIPPERLRYLRKPGGESHYCEPATIQKGLDALADAWLLSQCSVLVKTPSLLSAWSVIFNPALPVALVGQPRRKPYPQDHALRDGVGYFPENLLHRNSVGSGEGFEHGGAFEALEEDGDRAEEVVVERWFTRVERSGLAGGSLVRNGSSVALEEACVGMREHCTL
jgi:hypothetical protein